MVCKPKLVIAALLCAALLTPMFSPLISTATLQNQKKWTRRLTKSPSSASVPMFVHLLDRYARDVPEKTDFDRAVEAAMVKGKHSRNAAADLVKNFLAIPLTARQAAYGAFADPTGRNIPAKQIRETIINALKAARPRPIDRQAVPNPVKPAKPTEKDLKSDGVDKAEPPPSPDDDFMVSTVLRSLHHSVTKPRSPRPAEPLQIRYVGLYCREEADIDQGSNSDEIYLVTSVIDVARALPEGSPLNHPTGSHHYEDVDTGEVRRGPVISCYTGPPKDLTLLVTMKEFDFGDPNAFREEVRLVVDIVLAAVGAVAGAAGGVGEAILGALIGAGLGELLTDAINGLLDTEDDLIEAKSVFLSADDLANMYRSEVRDRRDIRYHFSTRHNENEGADYFAMFFVEDPNLHVTPGPGLRADGPRFLADLVVTDFRITGSAVSTRAGIEIPVRVEVTNRGDGSAAVFKVEIQYSGRARDFLSATFTVPGQESAAQPFTWTALARTRSAAFIGRVIIPAFERGATITIRALADSCAGEEFMPDYCRVQESNESNNISTAVTISLPR
jgi:hypothetical protein